MNILNFFLKKYSLCEIIYIIFNTYFLSFLGKIEFIAVTSGLNFDSHYQKAIRRNKFTKNLYYRPIHMNIAMKWPVIYTYLHIVYGCPLTCTVMSQTDFQFFLVVSWPSQFQLQAVYGSFWRIL